jgi:glucoamylase
MKKRNTFLTLALSFIFSASAYAETMGALSRSFSEWLPFQKEQSIERMFKNISPEGTLPGTVIASPSRQDPDYFFHWIRDAALVMAVVFQLYEKSTGEKREELKQILIDFTHLTRKNQLEPAPTGLGEPKFHVDGRAFTGPWGRPQTDGPALRAVVLIRFAHSLLDEGESEFVKKYLYDSDFPTNSVIKADLEYVSRYWGHTSFDLWEEVRGQHYYTRYSHQAALVEGAKLAERLNDPEAASWYRQHSAEVRNSLRYHWSDERGYIEVTRDRDGGADYKYSGLDASTLLAALHAPTPDGFHSIEDSRILATAHAIRNSFDRIYGINHRGLPATAIGRYPEDIYYGGNPWILTTAAYAEMYFKLVKKFTQKQSIHIDARNIAFYNAAMKKWKRTGSDTGLRVDQTITKDQPVYHELLQALFLEGDEFLKRIQVHVTPHGDMDEQLDRDSGYMLSARDLTWSHAAFLTSVWAREDAQEALRQIQRAGSFPLIRERLLTEEVPLQ